MATTTLPLPDLASLDLSNEAIDYDIVIRTFSSDLIDKMVKSMVYDDDKDDANVGMCETISRFCAISKNACTENLVFQTALTAFGVNTDAKKMWLREAWIYLSEKTAYDFMSVKPIRRSDQVTDRMLLGFVCEIVKQTRRLMDESASEFMQLYDYDFGKPQDKNEEQLKAAYEAQVAAWKTHVDMKAIFQLGTIGSETFDRIEFVLLLRKMMCNVYENDLPNNIHSLYAHQGRPYPFIERCDNLWMRCFLNFAWIMAELHNGKIDVENDMFPIDPTAEYSLINDNDWRLHFDSWNGDYWMLEYAKRILSVRFIEYGDTLPEFDAQDLSTRIVHELFPPAFLLEDSRYKNLLTLAANVFQRFKRKLK